MLIYSHLINISIVECMNNLTVVKTHRLIESAYSLSLLEQQMILFAIAHGREQDELMNGKIFTIRVSEFVRQFKIKDKNIYASLKEASDMFFNRRVRVVEYNQLSKTTEVIEYRWLQMHSYNDGEGTISIQFTDEVLKHITRIDGKLQKYTEYGFLNVTGLKTLYAIRLYELLRKNSFTGKYLVDVDWIREHFDIGDKYERVRDITKYVIERSLEEINEKSDINASFECIRAGRVVTQYLFTIRFVDRLEKKLPDEGKKQGSLFPDANPGESEESYKRRIREHQKLARKLAGIAK